MDWMVLLAIGARICLSCVLIAAGVSKAMLGTTSTARVIEAFRLAPQPLVPLIAVALPIAELCLGAALLAGVWVEVTDRAAIALISVLTAVAGITLARGLRPSCGCFGRAFEAVISPNVVARNLVLIVLLLFVLRLGVSMPATADSAGLSPLLTAPAVLLAGITTATFMFRRTGHGS
jgi:uncharacterized membrane protein YphA (DoxX/SURF4 family)